MENKILYCRGISTRLDNSFTKEMIRKEVKTLSKQIHWDCRHV